LDATSNIEITYEVGQWPIFAKLVLAGRQDLNEAAAKTDIVCSDAKKVGRRVRECNDDGLRDGHIASTNGKCRCVAGFLSSASGQTANSRHGY